MSQPTYLFFKEATTDTAIKAEVASLLNDGETIVAVSVNEVSPLTTQPLNVEIQSFDNVAIHAMLSAGTIGCSYGIDVLVRTNHRTFTILLAVNCNTASSQIVPYETFNPDAFKDLVGELQAGDSAVGSATFMFPGDAEVEGGYVLWELLAEDGTVFSVGNAFEYRVENNGLANTVRARAIISVPSNIPETLEQQSYQIRWTLVAGTITSYQFENITVVSLSSVPEGTQSVVEFQGEPAMIELVTSELYDRVSLEIYRDNDKLSSAWISDTSQPTTAPPPERTAGGWFYRAIVDTAGLQVSLKPYTAKWKYWNSQQPGRIYTERADLWVVNASILSAADDVKAKINKARTTLYGSPDLLFPYETIMTWLRRAADAFNGYGGVFTNFNFTNAQSGIREYWLLFAELFALESQYLAEGEKAFDFQGAAISLNVDRTQYLDSMASKIQSRLDNELKPFKQNLIIKGNLGGDGSGFGGTGNLVTNMGPLGSVGLLISPASLWGLYHRGPYARNISVSATDGPSSPADNGVELEVQFLAMSDRMLELGQTLEKPQFTVQYNRPIEQAILSDGLGWSKRVSGLQLGADNDYTLTSLGSVMFSLQAKVGRQSKTQSLAFNWCPRIYCGALPPGTTDPALIADLGSVLSITRFGTFVTEANAGQRVVVAVPTIFGPPILGLNGLNVFQHVADITIVNQYSVSIPYTVYESTVDGTGQSIVTVG